MSKETGGSGEGIFRMTMIKVLRNMDVLRPRESSVQVGQENGRPEGQLS